MATGTTNIHDLPTDPTGGSGSNVAFNVSEKTPVALDQSTINQIVNGLQQAGQAGVTQLPSRDIPSNTGAITQDPQVQPNYIPQPENNDYIRENERNEDIIKEYEHSAQTHSNMDEMYDELQTPLLLAVIYFMFQLPVFNKLLFKYLPFLFSKDGNKNISGFVFTSILFALIYYILHKVINLGLS